jgi:phosphoribosyl transferase-like protein
MTDFETLSLHHVSQLPLDANKEIFRQYPAFKLGVSDSVSYYAQLLLPLVKKLISDSESIDWIMTAPAITAQTPAAANLLCWELFDLYVRQPNTPTSSRLSLIDIKHDSESRTSMDWKDPAKSQDYAKLEFTDRLTEHERLTRRLIRNSDFQGRSILFVNDICVTGAQQRAMQQYFEHAAAACVRWLYVITVDQEIGRSNPEIEWQINFAPFEDLLRMVSREEIQFTGKCVQRLLHLNIAELAQVLRALNEKRRKQLLELVMLNGFQNQDCFQEQVELVRSYGTEKITLAGAK